MDQVMIEKTNKTMASGNTKTEKTGKKEAEYTTEEQEIIRLNTKLKDLQDLYTNSGKENKSLVKENRELTAKILEKQSVLDDLNKSTKSEIAEYEEAVQDYRQEVEVLKAKLHEKEMTANMFHNILLVAVKNN